MLSQADREAVASALCRADLGRTAIAQPSKTWPATELRDADAIQPLWAEMRVAAGARVIGHKIGLTSRAMRKASQITEPDDGVMLDDAAFRDGATIPRARFIRPRLEVDLRRVGTTLSQNGVIEESGVAAAVMRHPAAGVAWLVRKLHAVGAGLGRGQIVLGGSFTRPVDIAAGDICTADFGPLGTIGVAFARE